MKSCAEISVRMKRNEKVWTFDEDLNHEIENVAMTLRKEGLMKDG